MKVISHDSTKEKVYEAEREGCYIVLRGQGEYSMIPVDVFNRKLANESFKVIEDKED